VLLSQGGNQPQTHEYQTYQQLTDAEKDFVKRHPFVAWDFYQAQNEATDEAARRYPGEFHNGRGDAFRHAYWSALMTQARGEPLAREFGNAHENFPGNPPLERAMDLHNNAIGRTIVSAA
jgi:hypothetical protein